VLSGLPIDVPHGLMMIGGWTAIFFGLNRWLWRKGIKHYSGMGA
jgi:ABC-2 type transport system permease protein